MNGFLGPSNNKKAHQFLTRSGSFSTHGNSKGFVDAPFTIVQDQMNNLLDEKEIIAKKYTAVGVLLRDIRKKLDLNPKKQLKIYEPVARKGKFQGSKRKSNLVLEALDYAHTVTDLKDQIIAINVKIKAAHAQKWETRMMEGLRVNYPEIFKELFNQLRKEDELMFDELNQITTD